jgi:predicted ribosome quality control (RQC) complex YloA/Tae2 family protein
MAFDALMLSAVRDELRRTVLGGQVQRIVLSGELTVGLEIYHDRRKWFLVCSAEAEAARVCLERERPVRESDTPTPLLLLLRKYVRDGRIVGIDQPAYERLLRLRITKRDEEGIHGEVDLIIETMGRRSNVLLVDAGGLILDAVRRSGPTRNPRRPVLPRRAYLPPPPQERLDPLAPGTPEALRDQARPGDRLDALLAARLAGFSPLLAREIAFRAAGSPRAPVADADWARVGEAIRQVLAPLVSGEWRPSVAYQDEAVLEFAPYPLRHLPDADVRPVASPSEAVELGLATNTQRRRATPSTRALVEAVEALASETVRKRAALLRALEVAERAETLQHAGEAVLANLTEIAPGQTALDFAGEQVELDPSLSPLENAQRLFREYRKARDAARNVPELLAAAERQLRQLDDLHVMAEVADSPARQRAVYDELAELAGRTPDEQPRKSPRPGRQRPPKEDGRVVRHRSPDGFEVLVGASSRGNDAVTFKLAGPDDLWLHARGVPGAHVILRTVGHEPPDASLTYAARLAARNSRSRTAGRVEVDYTARKHVRRIPASAPGQVTYSGERTIAVNTE